MLALAHASLREFLEVGGFVVVCMAGITLSRLLGEVRKARRTRDWQAATATIDSVTMSEQTGFQGDNAMRSWRLCVTYTYGVQEQHTGSYTVDYDLRSTAAARVESLPGTTFPIRYNPLQEAESVVLIQNRPD